MKHLSLFKQSTFTIELPSTTNKATVWFFGDVHRDLPNCDTDRWKDFLKQAREDDNAEHTYYFGMGDYHDFASAKENKKLRDGQLHEQTVEAISELVQKRNRAFAMEIKQMRGRLIGLIGGNHTWILDNLITSDEDLANRMGCEYLGWLSFVNLRIKAGTKQVSYPIVACHGLGGGRVLGSQVRKVEDLFQVFPTASIYIMGHDHSRGAWPQSRLVPSYGKNGEIKIRQDRQLFCRSGSFMRAYLENESSYPVGKLMRPSDLGALRIDLSIDRSCKDKSDVINRDMKVIY